VVNFSRQLPPPSRLMIGNGPPRNGPSVQEILEHYALLNPSATPPVQAVANSFQLHQPPHPLPIPSQDSFNIPPTPNSASSERPSPPRHLHTTPNHAARDSILQGSNSLVAIPLAPPDHGPQNNGGLEPQIPVRTRMEPPRVPTTAPQHPSYDPFVTDTASANTNPTQSSQAVSFNVELQQSQSQNVAGSQPPSNMYHRPLAAESMPPQFFRPGGFPTPQPSPSMPAVQQPLPINFTRPTQPFNQPPSNSVAPDSHTHAQAFHNPYLYAISRTRGEPKHHSRVLGRRYC
jgi:hypothetical protein